MIQSVTPTLTITTLHTCARPLCGCTFIPLDSEDKYCSPACQRAVQVAHNNQLYVMLADLESLAHAGLKRAVKAGEEQIVGNLQVAIDAISDSLCLIEESEADWQNTIEDFLSARA